MTASSHIGWTEEPGMCLRYCVSGRGKHQLVLLHELGGSLESWDGVARHLDDEFRILRFDQRGAGLSEKPRTEFTLEDHVSDLQRVIAAAGFRSPVHLAGTAAGAAIAVLYASRHPDLVDALALCAPALTADDARRGYLADRSAAAVKGGMRAIADTTLARSCPPAVIRDMSDFHAYRARFLSNDPVCYAYANLALAHINLSGMLPQLSRRCLVVAGEKDILRPVDEVRALAESMPNATFRIINAGHIIPVQAARELSDLLRSFLLRERAALKAV